MEKMINYKNGRKNTFIKEGKYIYISDIKSVSNKKNSMIEEVNIFLEEKEEVNIFDDINLMVNLVSKRRRF